MRWKFVEVSWETIVHKEFEDRVPFFDRGLSLVIDTLFGHWRHEHLLANRKDIAERFIRVKDISLVGCIGWLGRRHLTRASTGQILANRR